VRFYDPRSWQLIHTVELSSDADNIRYDPTARLLYVGFGDGGIAIIDPQTRAKVAIINLADHPESFALERAGPRIFVNVPTAKRIQVLDRSARSVRGSWDMATDFAAFFATPNSRAYANFPMALDEAGRRLFVGFRRPPRLLVFDIDANVPLAQIDISGDADDILYDAVSERLYVACGEGFIDVIEPIDRSHYQRVARIPTAPGARTALWDSIDRRLYLAVPQRGTQPSAVRVYAQPR
jgi:DNA-binding beta-propeller fold protein YncE